MANGKYHKTIKLLRVQNHPAVLAQSSPLGHEHTKLQQERAWGGVGGCGRMGKEREKYLNEEGQLSREEMTSSKTMLSFKELCTEREEKRPNGG